MELFPGPFLRMPELEVKQCYHYDRLQVIVPAEPVSRYTLQPLRLEAVPRLSSLRVDRIGGVVQRPFPEILLTYPSPGYLPPSPGTGFTLSWKLLLGSKKGCVTAPCLLPASAKELELWPHWMDTDSLPAVCPC